MPFQSIVQRDIERYQELQKKLEQGASPTLFNCQVVSIQLVGQKFYISYIDSHNQQQDNEPIQIGEMNHLWRNVTQNVEI
jgi:CobQ-like glutamine amidotransferase family enzyme